MIRKSNWLVNLSPFGKIQTIKLIVFFLYLGMIDGLDIHLKILLGALYFEVIGMTISIDDSKAGK